MDILSYLSELIQTRKAVGVAGLGTVYKKKLPGRYDAETHSFVPPSYTIDFTAELKEEVLLAEHISKIRNVSLDTSVYFISQFSEGILRDLNDHQEANLGELGKLVKTGEQITLEPSNEVSFGFDFYGLPAVKVAEGAVAEEVTVETAISAEPEAMAEEIIPETPAVEEHIIEEVPFVEAEEVSELEAVVIDNERTEENPGLTEDAEITSEELNKKDEQQLRSEIEALNFYRSQTSSESTSVPEQEEVIAKLNEYGELINPPAETGMDLPVSFSTAEEEESKSTPLFLKLILALLILTVMMAAAYYVKPEWFNGLTGNQPAAVQKQIAPVTPVIDSAAADSMKTDSAAVPVPKKDTLPRTATVKRADTAVVYEIIGASMHDQKEADGFIAQMKKSGITAKVVTNMSGKRLKMSIATLKDEESAKLELDRLSKKLKIEGIYIYRNKQQ